MHVPTGVADVRSTVQDPRGRPPGFRLPAFALLVAGLVLGALEGGFAGSRWYPVAALAVCLVVLAAATGALGLARDQRPIAVALVAFAALTAWSYASILWADVPADALDGSNRMALYLAVLVLAAAVPWPAPAARAVFVVVVAGAGLLALATLFVSAAGADAAHVLVDGRLSSPLGYANATASLWLIALWPALALAVDDRLAPAWRGAALGAGALLLESALLTQSRGAALAFAVVAVAYVACSPRRGGVLVALAAVVAACAAAAGPLLGVREARSAAAAAAALTDARAAIVWSAGGLAVLAAIVLTLAARAAPRRRALIDARRLGDRAALGLAVAGTVAALVAIGSPVAWVHDRWDEFRSSGYSQVQAGSSRLSGAIGSNRYDFYRVALNEFREHPVAGIGADNFHVAYLEHRRSDEAPRYPHSLALRILAQLGLVGAAAFAALLAAAAVGVRRAMRSAGRERGAVVAAGAGFLAFGVQAMGDWLWSFPALGIVAFVLLGVALRAGAEHEPGTPTARPRGAMLAAATAVAAVAVVCFGALALSSRLIRSAQARAAANPAAARTDLRRAARLDPLNADPLVSAAILERRAGAPGDARADLDAALGRVPRSWFAHFERGLLAASEHDRAGALAQFTVARALNPRQPVVDDAIAATRAGRSIDPQALEADLAQQLERKLQPTGG